MENSSEIGATGREGGLAMTWLSWQIAERYFYACFLLLYNKMEEFDQVLQDGKLDNWNMFEQQPSPKTGTKEWELIRKVEIIGKVISDVRNVLSSEYVKRNSKDSAISFN